MTAALIFCIGTLLCPHMSNPPPRPRTEPPLERLLQLRASYAALPRARRELVIFGVALLCGLLPVPLLIWAAGNRVLGPYTHGQNMQPARWRCSRTSSRACCTARLVFWAVALGPAVLLLLLRLLVTALRAAPPARGGTLSVAGPAHLTSASTATPPRRTSRASRRARRVASAAHAARRRSSRPRPLRTAVNIAMARIRAACSARSAPHRPAGRGSRPGHQQPDRESHRRSGAEIAEKCCQGSHVVMSRTC